MRNRTIFVSLSAQHQNLGDLVIRREILRWLVEAELPVVALAAGMPSEFVDAFRLDDRIRVESSAVAFHRALAVEAVKGNAVVVLSPGPSEFARKPVSILKAGVNALLNIVNTARGGLVVSVGRAASGRPGLGRWFDRAVVRRAALFVARDADSMDALGAGVEVAPDIAFHEAHRPTSNSRTVVAISLRYDKAVDTEGLKALVSELRALGLEPMFVSQVKFDDEHHRRLASDLGVAACLWGASSHLEHLRVVREVYDRSAFTLSDRLHVSILGALSGAVPVVVTDSVQEKSPRTLAGRVEFNTISRMFEIPPSIPEYYSGSSRARLARDVETARATLEGVRARLLKILSS